MLHEILLALAGHPSPIFEDSGQSLPHISPSERGLLQSLGELASLHSTVRRHVGYIASEHPSSICRAVASAITSRHLIRFQKRILDTEREILSKDSKAVSAYNIVPLAGIVGKFAGWKRLLQWFWEVASFMLSPDHESRLDDTQASDVGAGPALLDKLRKDSFTGYADVETAALDLLKSAESTWLTQLTSFFISPTNYEWDFFIQQDPADEVSPKLVLQRNFLPEFVTINTAVNLLHIGTTLQYISTISRDHNSGRPYPSHAGTTFKLACVEELTNLPSPLTIHSFNTAVRNVRILLSQHLEAGILPTEKILDTIHNMQKVFLLGNTEFVDSLIAQSDAYLQHRHVQMQQQAYRGGKVQDLVASILREGELSTVLKRTWTATSGITTRDSEVDTDWGRENLSLTFRLPTDTSYKSTSYRDDARKKNELTDFSDFLLSTSTHLSLQLQPPLDLFLTNHDLAQYSRINSYLIAIRRAHLHLTALWHEPAFRKGGAFSSSLKSSYKYRVVAARRLRNRFSARDHHLRSIWITCNSAVQLILEIGDYFISEVVSKSWLAFDAWAHTAEQDSSPDGEGLDETTRLQLTPEVLTEAHSKYLSALACSLLLERTTYTQSLRTLLLGIDQLVAFLKRLQSVQSKLDLADEGVDDGFLDKYQSEEQDVLHQTTDAESRVRESIRSVVEALKSAEMDDLPTRIHSQYDLNSGFEPWTTTSIDHLLLKLDIIPTALESRRPHPLQTS